METYLDVEKPHVIVLNCRFFFLDVLWTAVLGDFKSSFLFATRPHHFELDLKQNREIQRSKRDRLIDV